MGDWHKVELQEDIDFLMETYGGFHDSCIVSLSFHFGGPNERILSVICQSQWEPKTIELQFSGLRQMHIVGWQDNYLCLILDAYLAFHNGLLPGSPDRVIAWSDTDCFDINKIDNSIAEPADTYIIANELRWRILQENPHDRDNQFL